MARVDVRGRQIGGKIKDRSEAIMSFVKYMIWSRSMGKYCSLHASTYRDDRLAAKLKTGQKQLLLNHS